MTVIIFLGPSLPDEEARQILPDALYLPPARQADLLSAVTVHKPSVIGLIDGVFNQSLSVWHKEILYAIEQGVRVYGASSMGALRAAECADFGMIGIGEIYRMYRDGELNDDDEVALAHSTAEMGYRNLSLPMINVRMTFLRAREEGLIDEATCRQITDVAKSIYFPERIWPVIFSKAAENGLPGEQLELLKGWVREHYVDLKRQDARLLLQTIRDLPEPPPRRAPNFTMHHTNVFHALHELDRNVLHGDTYLPLASIAGYAALHLPDFDDCNFHALNRALVVIMAHLLEVEVNQTNVAKEERRFRVKYNLKRSEDFEAWLKHNDLTAGEFQGLMYNMAQCRALQHWLLTRNYMRRGVKILLDELRLQNRYETIAEEATHQERILKQHYPTFQEIGQHDLEVEQLLLDHLRETGCCMPVHYSEWMKEAGFQNASELKIELLRSRLARAVTKDLVSQLAELFTDKPSPEDHDPDPAPLPAG